jgi:signal transduction histidine kinase
MWATTKDFQQLARYNKMGLLAIRKTTYKKELYLLILNKLFYLGYSLGLPLLVMNSPWYQILIGWSIMHFTCGMILALIFQPAHVVDLTEFPLPDEKGNMQDDWAAHQLKTPLAGLRMQAELAQRENSPEELQRSLEQIADSSTRATRLVQQLLSLARMENTNKLSEKILIDLSQSAADATKNWLSAAWEKNIDLGYQSNQQSHKMYGNPVMLKELFNNLIDNAIKYTPANGTVTVDVRHANQPGLLIVEVKDTGPGIPPEERQRVLERFYRILGSDIEGSGLGLAIVKHVMQRHGGSLSITSEVGHGSCFKLVLPAKRWRHSI